MSNSLSVKTVRGTLDLKRSRFVWFRFAPYLRKYWFPMMLALASAVGATVMSLAMPWTLKVIFDYVLSDLMRGSVLANLIDRVAHNPRQVLAWVIGAILLIAVLEGLFNYVRDVLLAQVGQKIVGRLRQNLFDHLQTLGPTELDHRRTGDLLARLTGDIIMLRQMLTSVIVLLIESMMTMVVMLGAIFLISWRIGLVVVVLMPVTGLFAWVLSKRIRVVARGQREKEGRVSNIAHDVISSMLTIQAYNREAIEGERFGRFNRSTVRAGVKTTKLESKLYGLIALNSAITLSVILFIGVQSVLDAQITAGDLIVLLAYWRGFAKPMRRVSKVTGQVAKSTACGERVAEILDIKPAIRDRASAITLSDPDGSIRFDGVTFKYGCDSVSALSDVSFMIKPGERIAVVGPSGAGKSTLIKLILRFYDPIEGGVYFGGHDVRGLTQASLRKHIAWVQQETVLYGFTVAENITLGRPDATADQVDQVARLVCADQFIKALPSGYDTILGQSGLTLSGGERQRLALARALLREPKLLLLDEPATGLDAQTRDIVTRCWMTDANQATTVVICHRLREMDRFDRVLVFDRGRLLAADTHAALLETCALYANAYSAEHAQPDFTFNKGVAVC